MGQALAESSSAAADVFAAADAALGEPISGLCFNGPEDELNLTVNSQPAILATSIAYLHALEEQPRRTAQAELLRRPLDGPVQRDGRGRRHLARRRHAASSASAAGRCRHQRLTARWPRSSACPTIRSAELSKRRARALGRLHDRQSQLTRPDRGQRRARGRRGAADGARSWAPSARIVLPVSVAAHSPFMALAAERMHAARPRRRRLLTTRARRCSPMPTRAC